MGKEYFKKFLEIDGPKEPIISYKKFSIMSQGEEGESLNFRENYDLSGNEELEVTDQIHAAPYGTDEEFHLRDLRGKSSVVLVFVHRREGNLESYDELGKQLAEQDIRMAFICRQGATDKKLEETNTPVLCDRRGDVAKSYGALDLVSRDISPSIVILDREGYIRFLIAGYMPKADTLGETVVVVLKPYEPEGA